VDKLKKKIIINELGGPMTSPCSIA